MNPFAKIWVALELVLAVGMAGSEVIPTVAPGEVLIRVKAGAGKRADSQKVLEELNARHGVVAIDELFPEGRRRAKAAGRDILEGWVKLRLTGRTNPRIVAAEYARLVDVAWAQPNYLRRLTAVEDSLFSQQWSLAEVGWDQDMLEEGGTVVVAVVDSGLDFTHPDIAAQVWQNRMEAEGQLGVDDDGNGYVDDIRGWDFSDAPGLPGQGDFLVRDSDPSDESGHGTHVAGIVAAVAGNGIGIAGVAPGARVMALRAGFNLAGGGYLEDDDLAAAIVYAAENGARVINMSWGDPFFSPLIRDAIRYADQQGCVLVAAAGNEGNDLVFYPARLDETIAVTASGPDGQALSFSNWGPSVDLAAPGSGILSLAPGHAYGERSGTSMAAPHVSGLAALLLARHPQLTPGEVRGGLALAAREAGDPGWDPRFGAGVVQVASLGIDDPVALQIVNPSTGTVLDPGEIAVRVAMTGLERWEVSWGTGAQPISWSVLTAGEGERDEPVAVTWDTEGLRSDTYLIRARGSRGGRWLEDRVEVRVLRQAPIIQEARLFQALDGPDWGHLLEWRTDFPGGGVVLLKQGEETVLSLPAVPERLAQRVQLPDDLAAGTYRLEVQVEAGELRGDPLAMGEVVVEAGKTGWGFTRLGRLPAGYLMPQIADMDGDGQAELAQMTYDGLQYNRGGYFRLEEGEGRLVHSSPLLFIPWNLHDLDGDGRLELMAVDARRVRLLETGLETGFPERLVWERDDVWGGEVADLDGDGRPEMFLRSARDNFFQVFESRGDDDLVEVAVLRNPTTGKPGGPAETNEMGPRQVTVDLDGDGRGELLAGDDDGDLFIFESIADDAFRTTWQMEETRARVDARVVGGGADLDGDGRVEFAVARLVQEPYLLRENRWVVEVYQATDNNAFTEEWRVEVLGGGAGGNGISVADLDGDGLPELILALVPDLYVLTATGNDAYAPVWHASISSTFRPAVGDWDGDGRADLATNAEGEVGVFTRDRVPEGLEAPAGFIVYARDAGTIILEWKAVSGAADYRIFRDGQVLIEQFGGLLIEDTEVETGITYRYAVAAVDAVTGIQGTPTDTREGRAQSPPRVEQVQRLSRHQLGVVFSSPMEIAHLEPFRFQVEPGVGIPASVLPDHGGQRVILGYRTLPDSGLFRLGIDGLRSRLGIPLAAEDRWVEFALRPVEEPARPLGADVLSPTQVALRFSKGVKEPANPTAVFAFSDPEIRIAQVQVDGEDVRLELAGDTPLQPLGRRYEVLIQGLEDEDGNRVDGSLVVQLAAADLSGARPFPNPFFPDRGDLIFGFLTPFATVYIHDAAGGLVKILQENGGDGGVSWDGRNPAGERVDSGVYFFKVATEGEIRVGKFALLRD